MPRKRITDYSALTKLKEEKKQRAKRISQLKDTTSIKDKLVQTGFEIVDDKSTYREEAQPTSLSIPASLLSVKPSIDISNQAPVELPAPTISVAPEPEAPQPQLTPSQRLWHERNRKRFASNPRVGI